MKHKTILLLVFLTGIGALLRFYNLFWGAPYFFHPDERNIASAIAQLSFPNQLNPHFFAYGSIPIYCVYLTGIVLNTLASFFHPVTIFTVSFEQAIFIGRILSAVFSVLLIPLLYITGKKLKNTTTGFFAAFFAATSIGFIQYAHFSTFEMWLTFFTTLLFFFCLCFIQQPKKSTLAFIGIVFGIVCGIKVSGVILLIPILFVFLFVALHAKKLHTFNLYIFLSSTSAFLFLSLLTYCLTNPFILLTPSEFMSSMHYEGSVALGTLPVFYSQAFTNTTPVFYQLRYIIPFLINPFIFLLFPFSFFFTIYQSIKERSFYFFLLLVFFSILFLSQAFFFVKWTRYMLPTLPFLYLITAIGVATFYNFISTKKQTGRFVANIFIGSIGLISILYAVGFTYLVYMQKDTRVAAKEWAEIHVPSSATILSEVYDLGIVPFNETHQTITLFNFYDLDTDTVQKENLKNRLHTAEYLILPSQRIIKTRINNPKDFPRGFTFYSQLLSQNGYKKIYKTECSMLCKILYLGDPVFSVEETTNIFDRPIVTVYKTL